MQRCNSSMVLRAIKNAGFQIIEFTRLNVMSREAEMKNVSLFTLNESRYFS